MVERLRTFHEAIRNAKFKAAPDETFLFLSAVKFLGHENTQNKIKQLFNQSEAIQQMKRPESKKDVVKLLRTLNFFSEYFRNVHVLLAPLNNLLHNAILFCWNEEHESVFNIVKQTLPHS